MSKKKIGKRGFFLLIAIASILISVSIFSFILGGYSLLSLFCGLVFAVYLTARLMGSFVEKNRNGKYNVFCLSYLLLVLFLLIRAYLSSSLPIDVGQVEESTTIRDVNETMATEKEESFSSSMIIAAKVVDESPLVSATIPPSLSTLPLEEDDYSLVAKENKSVEMISIPLIEENEVRVPSVAIFISSNQNVVEEEKSSLPELPKFISINERLVPSSPIFKETEIVLQENAVDCYVKKKDEEPLVDPWADFFFSDDELTLEDGIYYFSLFINSTYYSDIEVSVENNIVYISKEELKNALYSLLSEDSIYRIFDTESEYLSTQYLNEKGLNASFDSYLYEYYVEIFSQDLPLTRLSIRGKNKVSETRPIAGATVVDPVSFYLVSSYSLSLTSSIKNYVFNNSSFALRFSSSNTFRIKDVLGSFNWSLYYGSNKLSFNWGQYNFYYDIVEDESRLYWGNVSPDNYSPSGTSIGLRYDKSSQYRLSNSNSTHEEEIIIEKDSEVVVYNEEKEIYRKRLQKGRYILEDFILYTGANKIRIEIKPIDGSYEEVREFNINYASFLLDKGEIYYGAAFAFSRTVVSSEKERDILQFDVPFINGKALRYDIRDFALSSYLQYGLTREMSLSLSFGLKNSPLKDTNLALSVKALGELTFADSFGIGKINFTLTKPYKRDAQIYLRLSQQFLSSHSVLKGTSISLSYTSPNNWIEKEKHNLAISLTYSGSFKKMGYSVGLSYSFYPYDMTSSSLYLTPSLSFSLGKVNLSLSSSFHLYGNGKTALTSRVSASFRVGEVSNNLSSSLSDLSLSSSYSKDGNSVYFGAKTQDLKNMKNTSLTLDLSSSLFDLFSYSVGVRSEDATLKNVNLSLAVNTATVFADGLFSLSQTIPSSFLLIKTGGENTVSVASAGNSSPTVVSGFIGNSLYRGLNSNGNSLSIYLENENTLSDVESFDFLFNGGKNIGYAITLERKESYTVFGKVELDGSLWTNGSSPLYKVSRENGEIELSETDDYVFTDRRGYFVLSSLSFGEYAFDVKLKNNWVLYTFTIDSSFSSSKITELVNGSREEYDNPTYIYVQKLINDRKIIADEFWSLLYGDEE